MTRVGSQLHRKKRGESKRSKVISFYPQNYVGGTDKSRNVMNMILLSFEEVNAILSDINTMTFRSDLPHPHLE
jgi:hypothetical protein